MTGKEIVDYIIQNDAWDKEFFTNGILPGYVHWSTFASKWGVGQATIDTWCRNELIEHMKIGGVLYIHHQARDPRKKGIDDEINKDICNSESDVHNDDNSVICGGGYSNRAVSDGDCGGCRIYELLEQYQNGGFIDFFEFFGAVFGGGHKPPCQNCNGRSGKSDRTR